MLPRLTRRRVLAGCLLLAGALFLGLGIWERNWPAAVLGMAFWTAAVVGIGILLIQRVNSIKQLFATSHRDFQQLGAVMDKSTRLLKKWSDRTAQISGKLDRIAANLDTIQIASKLDRISANLETLSDESIADQSAARDWRRALEQQVRVFHQQFGDFVASVAEWMALAEVEAKQGVAEIVARQGAAVREGVDVLMQHVDLLTRQLGNVDGRLTNLDDATKELPQAIATYRKEIDSISRIVSSALQELQRSADNAYKGPYVS